MQLLVPMRSILTPEGADAATGADFDTAGTRFLREPDLALEEAHSDLRCCKNPTPERACSGRSRSRYGGKGTNP